MDISSSRVGKTITENMTVGYSRMGFTRL